MWNNRIIHKFKTKIPIPDFYEKDTFYFIPRCPLPLRCECGESGECGAGGAGVCAGCGDSGSADRDSDAKVECRRASAGSGYYQAGGDSEGCRGVLARYGGAQGALLSVHAVSGQERLCL